MSTLLIIELHIYSFILLVSCSSDDGLFIDSTLGCVCAVAFYQVVPSSSEDHPPICAACPAGSTTMVTNTPDINECG